MCGLSVKLPLRANLFGKFDSLSGVHSRNENCAGVLVHGPFAVLNERHVFYHHHVVNVVSIRVKFLVGGDHVVKHTGFTVLF